MQLPLVCEMPDENVQEGREPDVCLWAQSALFAEGVFTQSILQNEQIGVITPYKNQCNAIRNM